MNKKIKFAIPFAVLAISCGIAAGCDGCNDHEHVYSAWGHDETQHWKECPDDHEKDESTIADHVFIAGECECGATETVEELKYGNASGQVKIHKKGEYLTDFSDVTVSLDDDDVICEIDKTTGKFTLTDAVAEKYYELTISKPGYVDYTRKIKVKEGDGTVIGGTGGCILEYKVFNSLAGYDTEIHDHSKVNEAVTAIGVNGNGHQSLNVISTDAYGDVSASIRAKNANGGGIQGIVLKFADGTYAILNVNIGEKKLQYRPEMWGLKSVWGVKVEGTNDDKWIEYTDDSVVTDAVISSFNSDNGLEIRLVRKGGELYSFLDGRFIGKVDLPEGRADDRINVGFFSFDAKENAVWNYEITDTIPEMASKLDLKVNKPEGVDCSVTATPVKDTYAFGEEIELTFNAADGYILEALTVAGRDALLEVENGKLIIPANYIQLGVEATFAEAESIELDLTVKGKKLGTEAALAEGTEVKFKGSKQYSFNVGKDGAISAASVVKGRYTIQVDGYIEKQIDLNDEFNQIVLEYDTFRKLTTWQDFDFSNQNAEHPEFSITNDAAVVLTNDTYGTVKTSIYLKGTNCKDGVGDAGLVFRFVGAGLAANGEAVTIAMQGTKKVQFQKNDLWELVTVAAGLEYSNLIYFADCYDDEAQRTADAKAEEYLAAYKAGTLKLSVLREGATFYAFLNDTFIGQYTVDSKYENAECEVGFYSTSLVDKTAWKTWKVEIEEEVGVPDATVTDATTDAQKQFGSVTGFPEGKVDVGTTVTLIVKANEGYKLAALKVNGVDVQTHMNGNTYDLIVSGDTTVVAEFEQITVGAVNAQVTGRKYGVVGNSLQGNEKVTLTSTGLDPVEATLENVEGEFILKVDEIIAGKWTVNIDGYMAAEITVASHTTYTAEIALQYELFESAGSADLSEMSDGIITATGSDIAISTKASYTHVCAEATFDLIGDYETKERRYSITLVFEDGKNFRVDVALHENKQDNYVVQETDYGTMMGFGWQNPRRYTVEEVNAFKNINYKLIRNGDKVAVYVNGEFIKLYTLPEAYAEQSAKLRFIYDCNGADNKGKAINFSISDVGAFEVENKTDDENGTVAIKPAEIKLGTTVIVTATPNTGYKLATLTVDGKSVMEQVVNNVYEFTAQLPKHTVIATFAVIENTDVTVSVTGKKIGVEGNAVEGKTATLTDGTHTFTGTIIDGSVSFKDVVIGTGYSLRVDGFVAKTGLEVTSAGISGEIELQYEFFDTATAENADLSVMNDGKITATGAGGLVVTTKAEYSGNVCAEAVFDLIGDYESVQRRYSVVLVFPDNKACRIDVDLGESNQHNEHIIQEIPDNAQWGTMMGFSGWNAVKTYTVDQLKALKKVTYKLIRNGDDVLIYVNGEFIKQYTLPKDYKGQPAKVRFIYDSKIENESDVTYGIKYTISETLPAVTINNETAEDANGSLEITPAQVKPGDTVSVKVKPAENYILEKLIISGGVTPTQNGDTYTFVATKNTYTVTATFKEKPANAATASVSGIGLGGSDIDMNGKELTFTPTDGVASKLKVEDNKVTDILAAGEYTVSCEGFYDLTATVKEDGSFTEDTFVFEKKIFSFNFRRNTNEGLKYEDLNNLRDDTQNDPLLSNVGDSKKVAADGVIKATGDGKIYEWTDDLYEGDYAITATFKAGYGQQGVLMSFGDSQDAVRVQLSGNDMVQWFAGDWKWGTYFHVDGSWEFGSGADYGNKFSSALTEKYINNGISLTLAREGNVFYVLIDGKIYTTRKIENNNTKVRLGVIVKDAKAGYSVPVQIEETASVLAKAGKAVEGTDLRAYGGTWTAENNTLKVSGARGYAVFKTEANTLKESATIHVKGDVGDDQGIMYRFADGKYIAVRYQKDSKGHKIQYTMDTVFFKDDSLKSWDDWYFETDEVTTFEASGLDLKFCRIGKTFYTLLGDTILDKTELDEKYAEMSGVMGIMIWNGKDVAFTYDHKTGDEIPYYLVNASIDGEAHGYNVTVSKNVAAKGESVTVTITAQEQWWPTFGNFPTAIVVNDKETTITTDMLTSISANRCSYTYTVENVTADMTIKFKVTPVECIKGFVNVSVVGEGGTAESDSTADGYHWNDGCDVYIHPDATHEIESITITRGESTSEVITTGWGAADDNGKITYSVSGGITEPTTIVVKFKAKATTEPTTPDVGGETTGDEGDTTDNP